MGKEARYGKKLPGASGSVRGSPRGAGAHGSGARRSSDAPIFGQRAQAAGGGPPRATQSSAAPACRCRTLTGKVSQMGNEERAPAAREGDGRGSGPADPDGEATTLKAARAALRCRARRGSAAQMKVARAVH